eukprot:803087_1
MVWFSLLTVVLFTIVSSEIRLNGIFGNHMVLQKPDKSQGIPATHIYGLALLTDTVHIVGSEGFPGPFTVKPTTNIQNSKYGNWSVEIVPNANQPDGPYTITISAENGEDSITLRDIYFGQVFLCGGQSNMQVTIDSTDDANYEKQAANSLPNIRINQIQG